MNTIAVDIGNSATKISIAADTPLITIAGDDDLKLPSVTADPHHWIIVSVDSAKTQNLIEQIRHRASHDEISIIDNDRIPIATSVKQRSAVGTDRLMAAYAATQLHLSKNGSLVIVDAGTAVTIDLVTPRQSSDETHAGVADETNVFRGGLIFPGITTNLKSLSDNTAALPNLTQSTLPPASSEITVGDDTVSAILNGVVQSQSRAIISIASTIAAQHHATIVCTGGGIHLMRPIIAPDWHWVADLIHQGCRRLIDPT